MPVEHLTPAGVADVGIPQVSVASGSRIAYFSGQVGSLPDGTPVSDDLRSQFVQALRNAEVVATAAGVEPHHVAKVTTYVRDLGPGHLEELIAGVSEYTQTGGRFTGFSAGTLVGVAALYEPWCLVELDITAVID